MKTNQAEIKTLKFGETPPDGAEGNPEPSLIKEGVETEQGLCLKCKKNISSLKSFWVKTKYSVKDATKSIMRLVTT